MECRDFSSDIIFEILTRASLETLGRCRLVCKEWNLITYESSFMHHYCQRTKTIAGYFIQSLRSNKHSSTFVSIDRPTPGTTHELSLSFLPGPVKIEASSNHGILVCVNQKPRNHRVPQYIVCKPSTKQWKVIPNPKTRYFSERTATMVLRSNPLLYKIVRFSRPNSRFKSKGYHNLQYEIFNSETWAWKQLKDIQLPHGVFLNFEPAVSACGALHWLTTHNHIFTFHEDQESWNMFPLPQLVLHKTKCYKYMQLVEYEGRLALICMGREECMELWVMEDYCNQVWNKRRTLSIEAIRREDRCRSPVDFYNADIALIRGFFKVIFYKFQDSSSNVVRLEDHMNPQEVFSFRSDLETSNLKGNADFH